MMGVDKARAKARGSRIRENTFGAISILGGFPGVILGGLVFHHKTSKVKFWMPVVVALLLWDVLFLIAFNIVKL